MADFQATWMHVRRRQFTRIHGATITNVADGKESPAGSRLRVPSLDLSREYRAIGPELLKAVESVFSSQSFIMGPQVAEFERAAAAKCGVAHAIGCSSGTDALWLALEGARIGRGDAVITTAFSFFATVSAILRTGAQPLLADIDPETFNLDPATARACLAAEPAARAILPVHLYGQTVDWGSFELLKQEHNLLLIEDAAQAFGACWDGRPAGSLGDAAAFSFYPTKNLSAAGDAGMVTAGTETIAERVRLLRVHGMHRRYYHDEVGWNGRMDTIQAAVLLVKLAYIDDWNAERRLLAEHYRVLFEQAGLMDSGPYPQNGVVLPKDKGQGHARFPPIRHPGSPPRSNESLSPASGESDQRFTIPWHSISNRRCRAWDIPAGPFPRVSVPPQRYWRCLSTPNSRFRSKSLWWRRSQIF